MKKIFILFTALMGAMNTNAQKWDSLGTGVNTDCGGFNYYPYSITSCNGNIYVGGDFDYAGNYLAYSVAQWNGVKWDSLGNGIGPYCAGGEEINALCAYNSNLITGGIFSSINYTSANNVAQWNGSVWTSLGTGISGSGATVNAMCTYNGNLYVGGLFDSAGGKLVSNLAMWNGTSWSSVDSGLNGPVFALYVDNGNLYVGGRFSTAGKITANYIAIWNGTSWSTLGSGLAGGEGVYSVCNYLGNTYVGGSFSNAGSGLANNIAVWNGSSWSNLGLGITGYEYKSEYLGVFSMAVYNNLLYIGGEFIYAGGNSAYSLATWNGSAWNTLSQHLPISIFGPGYPRGVFAMTVFNGSLYVAGSFDSVGTLPVNDIAVWTTPAGINELNNNSIEVKVYPNPSAGVFTIKEQGVRDKEQVIEVYNTLGQEVYNKPLRQAQGDNKIDLDFSPTGIYLYRILDSEGLQLATGKFVIER